MLRIIAIDGPAGAGKSTVSRRLADALGFVLLDTGALYRAVALAASEAGVDFADEEGVGRIALGIAERDELALEPDPDGPKGLRVMLAGRDVSHAIRTPTMSMGASRVSAIPAVRAALLNLQRSIGQQTEGGGGVVAEGRDIGTVVFPEAPLKFFLTASLQERARRRQEELEATGKAPDYAETLAKVAQRDRQDTERPVAPLAQADDAVVVDSSGRSIDDIVAEMLRRAEELFV